MSSNMGQFDYVKQIHVQLHLLFSFGDKCNVDFTTFSFRDELMKPISFLAIKKENRKKKREE